MLLDGIVTAKQYHEFENKAEAWPTFHKDKHAYYTWTGKALIFAETKGLICLTATGTDKCVTQLKVDQNQQMFFTKVVPHNMKDEPRFD